MILRLIIFLALAFDCSAAVFTPSDQAWFGFFSTQASWINYTNIVLTDSPYIAWFFNTPNQVHDYAVNGTNNETWPSGWRTNLPPILTATNGMSSASNYTNSPTFPHILLGSTNALQQLCISTNPGTFEVVFVNNTNFSSTAPIFTRCINAGSPYNGVKFGSYTNGTSSLFGCNSPKFLMEDASGYSFGVVGTVNLQTNTPYMLDCQWYYTNSQYFARLWVNGYPVESVVTSNNVPAVNLLNGTFLAELAGFSDSGTTYGLNGNWQSFAYWTNVLTSDQIQTHYLASQNQTYNPSGTLVANCPGYDQNGNLVGTCSPRSIWCAASNLWYVYTPVFDGGFTNYGTGGQAANRFGLKIYSSPTLAPNSYTYLGTFLTNTMSKTVFDGVNSATVMQRTNDGVWVMWTYMLQLEGATAHIYWVSTAPSPAGPWTTINTNQATLYGGYGTPFMFQDPQTGEDVLATTDYPTNWFIPLDATLTNYYRSYGGYTNFPLVIPVTEPALLTYSAPYYYFINGSQNFNQSYKQTNIFYTSATSLYGPWSAVATVISNTNAPGAFLSPQVFQPFDIVKSKDGLRFYLTGTSWCGADVNGKNGNYQFDTFGIWQLILTNGTVTANVQKVYPLP